MRILATADVHLSPDHPERMNALEDVVRIAERVGVESLLIAGDMFDAGADVDRMKGDIRELFTDNGFRAYLIPGNHDAHAYRTEDYFGEDIEVLASEPIVPVDLGGATLVAVPYVEGDFANLIGDIRDALSDAQRGLLMLHGTLSTTIGQVFGKESTYLPFTPEQLLATGADYVVAGHIHSAPTSRTFGNGDCVFVSPGSPVSITTRETGRRGVWFLDSDAEDIRKIDVDAPYYVREELDLSPGEAETELAALEARLANRDLTNATLLVEPSGFLRMDEREFFTALTEIVSEAEPADVVIDRSEVESARTLLETSLYQAFERKLDEHEIEDERAIRRIALRGLSTVERA